MARQGLGVLRLSARREERWSIPLGLVTECKSVAPFEILKEATRIPLGKSELGAYVPPSGVLEDHNQASSLALHFGFSERWLRRNFAPNI